MPFITFIFKIENIDKTYYGKYCFDNISDDHEGLYNEVKDILFKGFNELRQKKNKNNIQELESTIIIGILSFSSNNIISSYSTDNEIKCFDFFYNYDNKIYIDGKLI